MNRERPKRDLISKITCKTFEVPTNSEEDLLNFLENYKEAR